jgi:hypothetical protein
MLPRGAVAQHIDPGLCATGSTASSLFSSPFWEDLSFTLEPLMEDNGSTPGSAHTGVSPSKTPDEENSKAKTRGREGDKRSNNCVPSMPYDTLNDGPAPKSADLLNSRKLSGVGNTLPACPKGTSKVPKDQWSDIRRQRMLKLSPQGPRYVKYRSVEPGD